jgi:hypothetical protein
MRKRDRAASEEPAPAHVFHRRGRRGDGWVYYRAGCSKWWIG